MKVDGKRPVKIEGAVPTKCASWAIGELVPPGRARMVGTWADVYDDDHEEMQACEANPDPSSALGLCAEHDRELLGVS
jgi:hypothetical protein